MDVTLGQLLGSVWAQGGLIAIALGSIAYDKRDALKALPATISAKVSSWRTGRKQSPSERSACESRRLTLIGIRHKSSELPAGEVRERALALCDEMDKLVAETLWPEAA